MNVFIVLYKYDQQKVLPISPYHKRPCVSCYYRSNTININNKTIVRAAEIKSTPSEQPEFRIPFFLEKQYVPCD